MPWWRSNYSPVLLVILCAFFVDEGLSQNVNLGFFSDNLCTVSIASFNNQVVTPNTGDQYCKDVDLPAGGDTRGYTFRCAKDYNNGAGYAGGSSSTVMIVTIDDAGCLVSNSGIHEVQVSSPGLCEHLQGNKGVYFKWEYATNPAQSVCGEAVPSPSPSTSSVSGDPVTWHGNVREEFRLPEGGVLAPLLQSPDMQVLASSRPGHAEDEWIDRVVITSAVGEHVLDVSIKRNLSYFNRAALLPNSFETLDVKMEWWRPGLVTIMPPGDAQFNHWSGISLAFGRVRHFGQPKAGVAPRREAVYIVSNSLKILVLSSAAREYFLERGDLGMEYSHLDLEIMEISDQSLLRGILPELWGLVPMSDETRALRKVPSPSEYFDDGPRATLPSISESRSTSTDANTTSGDNCSAVDSAMPKKLGHGEAAVASVEGLSGQHSVESAESSVIEEASVVAAL